MKREFEYINYSENERRAMLENSGAEVERLFGGQAPQHAAPGQAAPRYSGSERVSGRRPRERADAKNTIPADGGGRRGEARYTVPGNAASGRGAPVREGSERGGDGSGGAWSGRAGRGGTWSGKAGSGKAGSGRDSSGGDGSGGDGNGSTRRGSTGRGTAGSGSTGRGGAGRGGAGSREKAGAYGGRAARDAGADGGYGVAEPGYRAADVGRHLRDTVRLDAYRPPQDWELDDGGDTDYDEDPDDDADSDLDAEYEADEEYGPDEEYDEEADDDADAEADYDVEAAYDEDADYGANVTGRGGDSTYGFRAADGHYRRAETRSRRGGSVHRGAAVYHAGGPPGYGAGFAGADAEADGDSDEYGPATGAQEPDDRTDVLINHGRPHARAKGIRRWLRHWRGIGVGVLATVIGCVALALILPGNDASWPSSVALVQKEIDVACENPNVVSEPSQVNFACGKDTRTILWVFSLLTSGDNPNYSDAANGRKGLEPITPAQGGDVAWSLNLHHPYDPANPTDSLAVAARAINNIIGGATLTNSNGSAVVQPGLESTAANCNRYSGSSALVTRQGFPAVCAQPVTSAAGQAALVSDVFKQWMVGAPAQLATEAGVLFENADDPGAPSVQAILNTLPQTGL